MQARFRFPTLDNRRLDIPLLVDTGADRTVLSPVDAGRFGLDLTALPQGLPSTGVGGRMPARTIQAVLNLDAFSTSMTLTILEPPVGQRPLLIPSLLGRDILSRFAVYVEERTSLVLLLEPHEADALRAHLPA